MYEYDQQLQAAVNRVEAFMESLSGKWAPRATTTDSPMVFFNGFGRWCAKFDTVSGKNYSAFGNTLLEALNRLVDEPNVN